MVKRHFQHFRSRHLVPVQQGFHHIAITSSGQVRRITGTVIRKSRTLTIHALRSGLNLMEGDADMSDSDLKNMKPTSHQAMATPMSQPPAAAEAAPLQQIQNLLTQVVLPIWKAQKRLLPMAKAHRGVYIALRHIDSAQRAMQDMGVELRDYEGKRYDAGMKAVAPLVFEQNSECTEETVLTTHSPAVFVNGRLMVKSSATVGVPLDPEPPAQQVSTSTESLPAAPRVPHETEVESASTEPETHDTLPAATEDVSAETHAPPPTPQDDTGDATITDAGTETATPAKAKIRKKKAATRPRRKAAVSATKAGQKKLRSTSTKPTKNGTRKKTRRKLSTSTDVAEKTQNQTDDENR